VFLGFGQALHVRLGYGFRLEPIFDAAQAASKNEVRSKMVKTDSKIIISLVSLNP